MFGRRGHVNIAKNTISIHIHSYLRPVNDLISLKQSNEQVDDMFYLLMAPFIWHMVRPGGSTASVYN